MRRNRFTVDELLQELRMQGVLDPATVDYAILETNGQICTVLRPEENPVTPKHFNLEVDHPGWPTVLVSDGEIIPQNLTHCGRDERWLRKTLQQQGHPPPEQLFLLLMDEEGGLYVSEKER